MNEQDLKTIEEIKKDFKKILDVGEEFYDLLIQYRNKYDDFFKRTKENAEELIELDDLGEKGEKLIEKLKNTI